MKNIKPFSSHDDTIATSPTDQKNVEVALPINEPEKAALTTKDRLLIGATLATQTAANATSRQFLANFKLGSNTGEGYKDLFERFGKNPRTILSGVTHRFILQGYTQALPNYYNKTHAADTSKPSNDSPLIANLRTGTWMALAGMPFELSGLKRPIEDKADSLGKTNLNYWGKSPTIAKSILAPLLLRNNIYSAAVFGNSNRPLHERAGIAAIAGILTNPIDNLVNIAAYEAAIAKDGTPVADIFRATMEQFIGSEKDLRPYAKLNNFLRKSMNGGELRVFGVVGATMIFSKEVGKYIEEWISNNIKRVEKFLDCCETNINKKGGITAHCADTPPPSTSTKVTKVSSVKEQNTQQSKS